MKNLNIGTRMMLGYGIVLALLAAIAWFGIDRMALMHDNLEEIQQVDGTVVALANDMRRTLDDRMIALRNLALLTSDEDNNREFERIERQGAAYVKARDALAALLAHHAGAMSEERQVLGKLRNDEDAARPVMAKAVDLGMKNRQEETVRVLIDDLRPIQFKWGGDLAELAALAQKRTENSVEAANAAYARARNLMMALAAVAIAAGIGFSIAVTRGIVKPLQQAVAVAQSVARGDLTSTIDAASTDETGQLLAALRDMNGNLKSIVGEVRAGTDTIAAASQQIASGNADLSSRTEEQASSLEETASAMEELTTTVKQNAENAERANRLALDASRIAAEGGTVMADVVGTMGAIHDAACRIAEITSVIDGIAFQTNILALNAAVEAARAGAQGAGFAVVAAEVRTLAQRSAVAAKDIKALIDDSVERTDAGSRLVEQAGATIGQIVDSVRRVTGIMGEISAASKEQSNGLEQVTQAVAQMEQTTQSNAAQVEEVASTSESMQEQAARLARTVGVFRLEKVAVMATLASRAPARDVMAAPPRLAA
jgi:methyl-accepting chemotaxis protein